MKRAAARRRRATRFREKPVGCRTLRSTGATVPRVLRQFAGPCQKAAQLGVLRVSGERRRPTLDCGAADAALPSLRAPTSAPALRHADAPNGDSLWTAAAQTPLCLCARSGDLAHPDDSVACASGSFPQGAGAVRVRNGNGRKDTLTYVSGSSGRNAGCGGVALAGGLPGPHGRGSFPLVRGHDVHPKNTALLPASPDDGFAGRGRNPEAPGAPGIGVRCLQRRHAAASPRNTPLTRSPTAPGGAPAPAGPASAPSPTTPPRAAAQEPRSPART